MNWSQLIQILKRIIGVTALKAYYLLSVLIVMLTMRITSFEGPTSIGMSIGGYQPSIFLNIDPRVAFLFLCTNSTWFYSDMIGFVTLCNSCNIFLSLKTTENTYASLRNERGVLNSCSKFKMFVSYCGHLCIQKASDIRSLQVQFFLYLNRRLVI